MTWTLLTSHAQVLLAIAHDPGIRLRDIAATLGITERSACTIVADLTEAGYVAKRKDGRRNRYQIQAQLPLPQPASQHATIGELLSLLTSRRPGEAAGAAAEEATSACTPTRPVTRSACAPLAR